MMPSQGASIGRRQPGGADLAGGAPGPRRTTTYNMEGGLLDEVDLDEDAEMEDDGPRVEEIFEDEDDNHSGEEVEVVEEEEEEEEGTLEEDECILLTRVRML